MRANAATLGTRYAGDPRRAQFLGQPRVAIARAARRHAHLHVARVGKQAARREVVEQRVEFCGRFGVGRQLLRQLRAGVLAPGQQPQRPLAQRRVHRTGYSAALRGCGEGTFTAARIFASISSAICGLALRNSRALSLPWPIFSPP